MFSIPMETDAMIFDVTQGYGLGMASPPSDESSTWDSPPAQWKLCYMCILRHLVWTDYERVAHGVEDELDIAAVASMITFSVSRNCIPKAIGRYPEWRPCAVRFY
jgi:hypothetical protein